MPSVRESGLSFEIGGGPAKCIGWNFIGLIVGLLTRIELIIFPMPRRERVSSRLTVASFAYLSGWIASNYLYI